MTAFTEKKLDAPDGKRLKDLIAPDILRIETAMRADIASMTDNLDGLLMEVLGYGLFNGGKRFRPLLAILAARLCGKTDPDVYRLAIAFEYLHMATLFHDDVIDNADLRRGRPTVSRVYGMVAAILAGDFLHARSMSMVGECGGVEALKIFCRATCGIVDGEFIQLRNATNYNQSEKDYFAAITGKTALLIAATTEIGSLYSGGTLQERQALKSYGNHLGCAFQIIDDLLDYLGDENTTGKTIGNDLAEGKMTMPLILAMNRAEGKDREHLLEILRDAEMRKNCLADVTGFISKHNGFSDTKTMAEGMVQEALIQLEIFSRPDKSKDRMILEGLAQYVLTRRK
jgi:octaprenyl-diphosphate synthase